VERRFELKAFDKLELKELYEIYGMVIEDES
jgi:hypothetical protein